MITKELLSSFREDLKEAVKELEKKYGVRVSGYNATYSDMEFKMTLTINEMTANGIDVQTQRALDTLPWFKEVYQKQFKEGKHTYKIVGYSFNKTYSIQCIRDDGKNYSYRATIVNEYKFF